MKKIIIAIVISVTVGLFILYPNDKFKKEYESLNGKTNQSGKKYMKISIPNNNPIVYTNYEEIFKILEGGTGLIYFGFRNAHGVGMPSQY